MLGATVAIAGGEAVVIRAALRRQPYHANAAKAAYPGALVRARLTAVGAHRGASSSRGRVCALPDANLTVGRRCHDSVE
jgi:hypothetical protein